jgi:hypothetical protein
MVGDEGRGIRAHLGLGGAERVAVAIAEGVLDDQVRVGFPETRVVQDDDPGC